MRLRSPPLAIVPSLLRLVTRSWRVSFRLLVLFSSDPIFQNAFFLSIALLALQLWLIFQYLLYVLRRDTFRGCTHSRAARKASRRAARVARNAAAQLGQRGSQRCGRAGRPPSDLQGARQDAQSEEGSADRGPQEPREAGAAHDTCSLPLATYGSGGGASDAANGSGGRASDEVNGSGGREDMRERVEERIAYLTNRFASHAGGWQFMIWMRQLALFLSASVPRLVIEQYGLDGGAGMATVFAFTAVALVVLLGSWRMHSVVRPYEFAFQNALENLLFASDVALVVLGSIYTLFLKADVPPGVLTVVEALLMVVLVGAIAGAGAWLALTHFAGRQHVTQDQADAERTHSSLPLGLRARRWRPNAPRSHCGWLAEGDGTDDATPVITYKPSTAPDGGRVRFGDGESLSDRSLLSAGQLSGWQDAQFSGRLWSVRSRKEDSPLATAVRPARRSIRDSVSARDDERVASPAQGMLRLWRVRTKRRLNQVGDSQRGQAAGRTDPSASSASGAERGEGTVAATAIVTTGMVLSRQV